VRSIAAAVFALVLLDAAVSRGQDQCRELPPGTATINGTVTAAATSNPVSARIVASGEVDGYGPAGFMGDSGFDGIFSIEVAAPGSYVLTATTFDFSLAPEYYDGAVSPGTAIEISVAPGQVVDDVDFTLVAGATLSGRVIDDDTEDPIEGVVVTPENMAGLFHAIGITQADGTYSVSGLAEGNYQIGFFPNPETGDFLGEYYNDLLGPPGDIVNVTAPGLSGFDARLALGGRVEGTVTGDGAPLVAVFVRGISLTGYQGSRDSTDASGQFSLLAPAGPLKIHFGSPLGFVGEYYDDQPDLASATNVIVNTNSTIGGIDADLARSGKITGTVTDSTTGEPLQDVSASAYDSTDTFVASGVTNESGVYVLDHDLPTGAYRLRFSAQIFESVTRYATRYYSDKATLADATPVNVTAPDTTTGIDQALTPCDELSPSTTTTTTTTVGETTTTTTTTVGESTTTTSDTITTTSESTTTTTLVGAPACGDPVALFADGAEAGEGSAVTASDALFVLQSGIGLASCELCVCDVNDSGEVSATDALIVLRAAVGQPVTLACPACA
jgi:5-hydroxyisourate hydrolase-like protein (transthyretin family)